MAGIVIQCDWCGTPIARLCGDILVFERKHHGDTHTTTLKLSALQRLAAGERGDALRQEVHYLDAGEPAPPAELEENGDDALTSSATG